MAIKRIIFILLILHVALLGCNGQKEKEKNHTPAPIGDGESGSVSKTDDDYDDHTELDKIIDLPQGFSIDYFARNIENARSMVLGDNGTLFVGTRRAGNVYAVIFNEKRTKAEKVILLASGLDTPNGVAFKDGSLFVAEISRILRYDNIETRLENPPDPVVVTADYPKDRGHGWKFIAFGPDGRLYVPVGAPCNICDSASSIYASITRINADGSDREIFARGIRNTVGFAWHPQTQELWFTDNGRDWFGDDRPPDELNHASKIGLHFGYPYCHGGMYLDDKFGEGKNCSDYEGPVQNLGPHVAALGMRFYTGNMFPAEYKNRILIAEHGSWNRSVPIGYRVMMVRLDEKGKSKSYEVFAKGWLDEKTGKAWGRPVDVLVMEDGSLLVSDDYNNAIYRISYSG